MAEGKEITAGLVEFENLQRKILKAEAQTLPDLEQALDELLDEVEESKTTKVNRLTLKQYLMIPIAVAK